MIRLINMLCLFALAFALSAAPAPSIVIGPKGVFVGGVQLRADSDASVLRKAFGKESRVEKSKRWHFHYWDAAGLNLRLDPNRKEPASLGITFARRRKADKGMPFAGAVTFYGLPLSARTEPKNFGRYIRCRGIFCMVRSASATLTMIYKLKPRTLESAQLSIARRVK